MASRYEVNPLEGGILKNMLIFSLPIMGAALLHVLFSAADTAVLGNFGHEGAISAVGVSASLINMLIGGLTALSAGVTVTVGKLYGEGRKERVSALLHDLPLTGGALGAILTAAVILLSGRIMGWMNCPESIRKDALAYFRIYFLGVPFSVMFTFLSSVLQARGNSLVPLLYQTGASVMNVVLNLVFVIMFDWNVVGVAVATALSQAASFAALTVYMTRQKDELRMVPRAYTLFRHTGEVFRIGIPSSLEGVVLNLSGTIIMAAINRFDTDVIAGNTVATTIEGLMTISFVGMANASVVFISQNYGNGNYPRIRRVYHVTLASVFLGAEMLGVVIYLAAPYLIRLFTDQPAETSSALTRMFYMCLFFGFCGLMNVVSGCVRGLGEARLPLAISLICSVGFRLTWIYTYAAKHGTIESIYISYPLCWALCAILNIAAFSYVYRKRLRGEHGQEPAQPACEM